MRTLDSVVPGIAVTVEVIPEPDLRQPRRDGVRTLWRYDGTTAVPVPAEPTPRAGERIRQLAHPAWPHPPAAYDAAVALATVEVDDLIGLLVHPPAEPSTPVGGAMASHDPALWVRCVQVWACLGLLHHRTDEPWADSTRRRVLLDLVWGVEDWITEAALFALVTAAWVDPTARADIARIITDRLADIATVARLRPITIAWSVARLALVTPDLEPQARRLAEQIAATEETGPITKPRRSRLSRFLRWLLAPR
jgi:hypothetical protein